MIFALVLLMATPAFAHHPTKNQYILQVENLHFTPQQLDVPAATPFKLVISNNSAQPITFTSQSAALEKSVPAHGAAVINVPSLAGGQYDFTITGQKPGILNAIVH